MEYIIVLKVFVVIFGCAVSLKLLSEFNIFATKKGWFSSFFFDSTSLILGAFIVFLLTFYAGKSFIQSDLRAWELQEILNVDQFKEGEYSTITKVDSYSYVVGGITIKNEADSLVVSNNVESYQVKDHKDNCEFILIVTETEKNVTEKGFNGFYQNKDVLVKRRILQRDCNNGKIDYMIRP